MIKAVVVPYEGDTVSPIAVSEHCEKLLIYYRLPRYIEIRDKLPRSASGKVGKDLLQDTSFKNTWDRKSGYELNRRRPHGGWQLDTSHIILDRGVSADRAPICPK